MNLTKEHIAKLIYGISQLRYWEQEFVNEPAVEMKGIVMKWQKRMDELISDLGAKEYIGLKELINDIKIIEPIQSNQIKIEVNASTYSTEKD